MCPSGKVAIKLVNGHSICPLLLLVKRCKWFFGEKIAQTAQVQVLQLTGRHTHTCAPVARRQQVNYHVIHSESVWTLNLLFLFSLFSLKRTPIELWPAFTRAGRSYLT